MARRQYDKQPGSPAAKSGDYDRDDYRGNLGPGGFGYAPAQPREKTDEGSTSEKR